MSAFVVNKRHIDAIITAGLTHNPSRDLSWDFDENRQELTRETANRVGAMLWAENIASVRYRYADADVSGMVPADSESYVWATVGQVSVVQVLKFIDCLEYQSCEHPEWNDSEAKVFCNALRNSLIFHLPGYKEADWEWTTPAKDSGSRVPPLEQTPELSEESKDA